MRNLPSGTVTFLFTDIEGSTKLWEERPQAMQAAHARQEAILREAITKNEGYAYKMIGDAFQAAFSTAPQALQAALDAQRALDVEPWGATGPIRVRMALHTGLTEERGTDYVGPILNRVARLMSAGHGGQVLISLATEQLVREHLPQDVSLRDLGEHRLKDLQRPERVFQLVAPGLRADFPPLSTLDNRPNNLPLQSTPFIGRAAEVAEVRSMLLRDDVHLLTLTGAGGTGKTRLALQVAAELLDEFKDGVFFVYLAPITDPALVISTIAQTLGVGEEGTQPLAQTLQEYLRDKIMLLVLDNFEQVLDAAPLVSDLLRAAPHLKVLATSRATLRLSWERRYEVPLLSVPDPGQPPEPDTLSQYESVELFIARAEAARPGFVVDNSNAPVVAEICYRLEGLPLAIELAAAWVKTLPPKDILSRLGSRLKLLTRGPVDQPSRHQTLRNTIEWSYDLLTAEEQSLFRQVAVFVGGHTLEAAETVCGTIDDGSYRPSSIVHRPLEIDILDGLASLVEKSLMYQAEGVEGEARFSMLETVREYAREKLQESGEAEALQEQHARYFMALAEDAESHLTGADQVEWLARLELEHDNLRAALHWAQMTEHGAQSEDQSAETALMGVRAAGALWRFWWTRGYLTEGREKLMRALTSLGGEWMQAEEVKKARAKVLHGIGNVARAQGDFEASRSSFEEALALRRDLGDEWGIAASLGSLGNVAINQGDYASARPLYEEALVIFRDLDDKRGIGATLNNLGLVATEQGDYPSARPLYEEALSIHRESEDKGAIATALNNLGLVASNQRDNGAALALHEETLSLRRELEDKAGIATSLTNLGLVAADQGDHDRARSLHEEALAMRRDLGDKLGIAASLSNIADVAHAQEDYVSARSLQEESLAIERELGNKAGIASSLNNLGHAAHREGDTALATQYYTESLNLSREMGSRIHVAISVTGLGAVATTERQTVKGARLLGAVDAILAAMDGALTHIDRIEYEQATAIARAQLDDPTFERARAEGRAMSMEQAIEYALEETGDG